MFNFKGNCRIYQILLVIVIHKKAHSFGILISNENLDLLQSFFAEEKRILLT